MPERMIDLYICPFCDTPVDQFDDTAWKQVKGWVHGPKAHGLTLREYTDRMAHDTCVNKARSGQAADQPSLLDEDDSVISVRTKVKPVANGIATIDPSLADELFDGRS